MTLESLRTGYKPYSLWAPKASADSWNSPSRATLPFTLFTAANLLFAHADVMKTFPCRESLRAISPRTAEKVRRSACCEEVGIKTGISAGKIAIRFEPVRCQKPRKSVRPYCVYPCQLRRPGIRTLRLPPEELCARRYDVEASPFGCVDTHTLHSSSPKHSPQVDGRLAKGILHPFVEDDGK